MRNLLLPNPCHYIVTARNPSTDPLKNKILHHAQDTIDVPLDGTINTLDIYLCKKLGRYRLTEINKNFPLKYREEAKNNITEDQTNQTLIQTDDYNTKVTRYLGPTEGSQIEKDSGMILYLENGEHVNDIILYKFKADIDLALVTKMRWIVYPSEPLQERVFIRFHTFANQEIHRNISCVKQFNMGSRRQNCTPIPVGIVDSGE